MLTLYYIGSPLVDADQTTKGIPNRRHPGI